MKKKEDIRRYTADELRAKRLRGESRTDLAALDAMTDEQLEANIASDPDLRDVPENWYETAQAVVPENKRLLSLRLDADIVDWFRAQGAGYQTRMNAVLKAFVMHEQKTKKRA